MSRGAITARVPNLRVRSCSGRWSSSLDVCKDANADYEKGLECPSVCRCLLARCLRRGVQLLRVAKWLMGSQPNDGPLGGFLV